MPEPRKRYDSTVARIAGNILSGRRQATIGADFEEDVYAVRWAVGLARKIVKEVELTDPVIHPCGQEWTDRGERFVCVLELNHHGACEHA